MALSHELISQFAKVVNHNTKKNTESTVYGTVVTDGNGNKYVKLDGSDQLTPLSDDERPSADSTTTSANTGERVSVLIKNHMATVTGNISTPSARSDDVKYLDDQVTKIKKFDIVLADRVQANEGYIKSLQADKANVGDLTAATARIIELETKKASIEELNAAKAEITDLKATKIDADVANAKFATIENLDTTNASIDSLSATHAAFETATADNFTAVNANIDNLEATKITAEQAELKFANINFGNITEAAIKKLFTDSGIIKNLVVSEGHITGELVGVTIKGDLIEGGTVKADKLVILGENGLYYKLNVNSLGETTATSDTKYQNGLDGSVIIGKSVTAEKVMVDDLVAFNATIGGINISDNAMYSGVKSSADNKTRGFYLDKDGQLVTGDSNRYLKYYKDTDESYKLAISADSIYIRSGDSSKNIKNAIEDVETRITSAETSIEQNAEAIALRVTKTEIAEEINKVQVGGRNLLVGTSNSVTHTGTGSTDQVTNLYNTSDYYRSITDFNGKTFTLSFDWETTATSGTFLVQLNGTPWLDMCKKVTVSSSNNSGRSVFTFDSDSNLSTGNYNGVQVRSDDLTGTITIKNAMFEEGNKPSSWQSAPEDVDDNINDTAENLNTTLIKTITDHVTAIQINTDSISASVEKLETSVTKDLDGLRNDIQTVRNKVDLQLTEDEVDIQIDKKLQNGVNKVKTSTGFKFDENGLNINKSSSPTNTQITENGMTVNNTETGDSMLTADKDGVDAKNLQASTYLIVGGRSRFENYGTNRTGCFWIGE